jgi:sugar phosphate isomerase/epimerase
LGGIKEDWTVPGEARKELVKRLHEVGEMAHAEGLVVGIRTQLDAKANIKLLKEIKSEGIKIYYCFQSTLENGWDLYKDLKRLGKKRICMIHCTDTDGVTLPYNTRLDMYKVKKTLDKMGWSGWLVVERSRNAQEARNVKKNFGINIQYLKKVFQGKE